MMGARWEPKEAIASLYGPAIVGERVGQNPGMPTTAAIARRCRLGRASFILPPQSQ
jgi:hypothetical protein